MKITLEFYLFIDCQRFNRLSAYSFPRAAQKMSQASASTSSSTSTPHKKKRHEEEGEGKVGFSGVLYRSPPQVPPALLRKIGVKETTGVGKVRNFVQQFFNLLI